MNQIKKWATAAGAGMALVAAACFAQEPGQSSNRSRKTADSVTISGRLSWLALSALSAKHEGVLDQLEFREGMRVQEGQEIGRLDDKLARLTVTKQQYQVALNDSQLHKAEAQRQQAMAVLARMKRANERADNVHSREEIEKAAADVDLTDALIEEANGKRLVDEADLELARAALENHIVRAPFTGVVIERIKNPGEAVRANEPVVRLGKTDSLQFVGWMPLEYVEHVRVGDAVQFRPVIDEAKLNVEDLVFEGRLTAIGPEVSSVQRTEIRVFAEINNPSQEGHPELDLYEGIQGDLTVPLTRGRASAPARAAARTDSGAAPVSTTQRSR